MGPLRTTEQVWKGGLQGRISPYPLSRWVPPTAQDSSIKPKNLPYRPQFWKPVQYLSNKNNLSSSTLPRNTWCLLHDNTVIHIFKMFKKKDDLIQYVILILRSDP